MKPAVTGVDAIVQQIAIHNTADKIFAAITSPEALVKWWSVAGKFHVTKLESDLRPGGKWRMHLVGTSGAPMSVAGEYRDVQPPTLLTYSWIREQESSHESLVRWDLEEEGGVTTVRVTHSGLTTPHLRSRNDGWPLILTLLQAYLEGK